MRHSFCKCSSSVSFLFIGFLLFVFISAIPEIWKLSCSVFFLLCPQLWRKEKYYVESARVSTLLDRLPATDQRLRSKAGIVRIHEEAEKVTASSPYVRLYLYNQDYSRHDAPLPAVCWKQQLRHQLKSRTAMNFEILRRQPSRNLWNQQYRQFSPLSTVVETERFRHTSLVNAINYG